MLNRCRKIIGAAALTAVLALSSASTAQAQSCQPGNQEGWNRHATTYTALWYSVQPYLSDLSAALRGATNDGGYNWLLAWGYWIRDTYQVRVVFTLPDGTVVVDTARSNNTYANYIAKAINENHNSRLAIFAAQEYPCGYGLESKYSSTTGQTESYLAFRLGAHTDSDGTVRVSKTP